MLGLSILINGSTDEKLAWTFHLYDLDGDGVISREEMEDLAMAVSSVHRGHRGHIFQLF